MHRHLVVFQCRCVSHVLTANGTGSLSPWSPLPFLFHWLSHCFLDVMPNPTQKAVDLFPLGDLALELDLAGTYEISFHAPVFQFTLGRSQ